jgi:hypothetical protein
MTDSDLNFLSAVIGCMLAAFWVVGRLWLAIASRLLASSTGPSAAVAVRPGYRRGGPAAGLAGVRGRVGRSPSQQSRNPMGEPAAPPAGEGQQAREQLSCGFLTQWE